MRLSGAACLVSGLALACLTGTNASAQMSRGGVPSVEVNTQLIESLGPGTSVAPTIPALPGLRVGPGYPGGAGYAYLPGPAGQLPPPRSQLHLPLAGGPQPAPLT
ncbi:MAG: hypothetical protein KIT20_15835, partial [Alphaproteobacteria bacterium]|nr:hypothetical protein [Alphaproteobacteria bacterium]